MNLKDIGLNVVPDFITEEEEIEILSNITIGTKKNIKSRNTIKRYGSDLPYKSNIVSKVIPDFLDKLCCKLFEQQLSEIKPDSATINEYLKGQGITFHVDSVSSGDVITTLSLKNSATMRFRKKTEEFAIELPRRCLVQMSGEIRQKWEHGIDPVKDDRYSIVFRCSKENDQVKKFHKSIRPTRNPKLDK